MKKTLLEAAELLEENAGTLRQSSTVPSTGEWPSADDEADYNRHMHTAHRLREIAGRIVLTETVFGGRESVLIHTGNPAGTQLPEESWEDERP